MLRRLMPVLVLLAISVPLSASQFIQLPFDQVAREFIYEIYEGDQLLIVGYDEQAEIVTDWTDNPKQVEASLNMIPRTTPFGATPPGTTSAIRWPNLSAAIVTKSRCFATPPRLTAISPTVWTSNPVTKC